MMLVEAANVTPYGKSAARLMETEHGVFYEQNKANTKVLREAEALVRRNNREFSARKNTKKKCGTRWNKSAQPRRRTLYQDTRITNGAAKNVAATG